MPRLSLCPLDEHLSSKITKEISVTRRVGNCRLRQLALKFYTTFSLCGEIEKNILGVIQVTCNFSGYCDKHKEFY